MLVVRLEFPAFSLLIVVTRGPHSQMEASFVQSHWQVAEEVVIKLRRHDEHIIVLTDANAHLHSENAHDIEHARWYLRFMERLGLSSNAGDAQLDSFMSSAGTFVQDDYINTSGLVAPVPGTTKVPTFADTAKATYHEPVMMKLKM